MAQVALQRSEPRRLTQNTHPSLQEAKARSSVLSLPLTGSPQRVRGPQMVPWLVPSYCRSFWGGGKPSPQAKGLLPVTR